MKKIIFNCMLISSNLLLLFQNTIAQTSPHLQQVSSTTDKNQSTTAGNRDEQGWRQLFNGTDLTGWKHVGKGDMLVEDGMIHGKGGMGLLYWTSEKFKKCTFRVVYKMQKANSNAGIFIRIPI